MEEAEHSELEYLILAMATEGISSGYAMRVHMNRMDGLRWSAESGSVYRVLRRLVSEGMIRITGKAGIPKRERTEYAITTKGRDELVAWLPSELTQDELALLIDPVRVRARYFDLVAPEAQKAALELWMKQNAKYIRQLRKRLAKPQTAHDRADANLLALAKARQTWLRAMAESLPNGK